MGRALHYLESSSSSQELVGQEYSHVDKRENTQVVMVLQWPTTARRDWLDQERRIT